MYLSENDEVLGRDEEAFSAIAAIPISASCTVDMAFCSRLGVSAVMGVETPARHRTPNAMP